MLYPDISSPELQGVTLTVSSRPIRLLYVRWPMCDISHFS